MEIKINIFYLDSDPKICAEYHVDRHVVKMIIEYAQLLSTAHRVLDGKQIVKLSKSGRKQKAWILDDEREDVVYAATHINHPSAKWCRHSKENYDWLFTLWTHLLDEYTHRYGKQHSCQRLLSVLSQCPKSIDFFEPFCPPWRAMPDEYKVAKSDPNYTVKSYRAYYIGAKPHMFKWKNRQIPHWIEKDHG